MQDIFACKKNKVKSVWWVLHFSKTVWKYDEKNRGPRTDAYGTPKLTGKASDTSKSKRTLCERFNRKFWIREMKVFVEAEKNIIFYITNHGLKYQIPYYSLIDKEQDIELYIYQWPYEGHQ